MPDKPKFRVGDEVYFEMPIRGGDTRKYLSQRSHVIRKVWRNMACGNFYTFHGDEAYGAWEDELEPVGSKISEEDIWE